MKSQHRTLVVIFILSLAIIQSTPFAELGQWYRIPSYTNATASVRMDTFTTAYISSRASGYIYLTNNGGNCVYVQRKPVARFAIDGDWKRSTPNRCSSGSGYYSWQDTFHNTYNGFKFRICRDRTFEADLCGNPVTVYP